MAAWPRCSDANRMSRAGSFCDSEPEQPSGGAAQDQLIVGIRALWTTDFGHSVFCSVWYNGGFSWQEAAFGPHILHTSCSAGVCRAPALRESPEKAPSCQPQNLQALEYFRVEEWMDFSHWFSTPLSYVNGISYTLVPIPQKRMHWMIERQNDSEWTKVKVWE